MISVSLVGRVTDRPFRPGNAQRVVLKLDADDERGRTQHLEVDAFGEIGDWVMKNVTSGETLAVSARLEERTYRERGEEVDELRIVAVKFEPTARRPSTLRSDPNSRAADLPLPVPTMGPGGPNELRTSEPNALTPDVETPDCETPGPGM